MYNVKKGIPSNKRLEKCFLYYFFMGPDISFYNLISKFDSQWKGRKSMDKALPTN